MMYVTSISTARLDKKKDWFCYIFIDDSGPALLLKESWDNFTGMNKAYLMARNVSVGEPIGES